MSPVPDVEFTGTITSFNLEQGPDGTAVLVVYTKNDDGTIGRAWLRFEPESARALKSAARDRLRD